MTDVNSSQHVAFLANKISKFIKLLRKAWIFFITILRANSSFGKSGVHGACVHQLRYRFTGKISDDTSLYMIP